MTDTITIKFTLQQVMYFVVGWLFTNRQGWSTVVDGQWLHQMNIAASQVQAHIFEGAEIDEHFTAIAKECALETARIFGRNPSNIEPPVHLEPLPEINHEAVPYGKNEWCPTFNRVEDNLNQLQTNY